ncbi:MAG: hypothetical protein KZQ99_13255 [Candidatus Thiodiazotropha sp. (ex Dulcina madagascariensis)]|nr:hypothetical protein [Candidatus Thiodiazotropha sp. (ex Dulcina madagascariensis)]
MYRKLLGVLIPACLLSLSAVAAGVDNPENNPAAEPSHDRRGAKKIALENSEGASVTLWKPDLSTQPLTIGHGGVTIPNTGIDNYHAVVAEKDWGDHKEVVIRYEYLFGRPSKQSPSKLAGAEKADFEIAPDPIPREHYRYHSQQTWGFLLRLHGRPLPDLEVTLQTTQGSQRRAITDQNGRVEFQIPDDFPNLVEGERDKRQAQFTVSSEHRQGDVTYTTQLNADYRVNPTHWQSTRLGLLVVGIGFLAGGFLGRVNRAGGRQA